MAFRRPSGGCRVLDTFLGPLGGALAAMWGAGAMMGYAFAHKTIGKRISELREDMAADKADCDRRIDDLTHRLREIEDRAYHGMERQASQARQSAAFLIDRGEVKPLGGTDDPRS